jgi:hypothetical protein
MNGISLDDRVEAAGKLAKQGDPRFARNHGEFDGLRA